MPLGVEYTAEPQRSPVEKRSRRMATLWKLVTVFVLLVVFSGVPGGEFCASSGKGREEKGGVQAV